MSITRFLIALLAALALVGMTSGQAMAGNGNGKNEDKADFCSKTASKMFYACGLDILDDYAVTLANCENIDDWHERKDCRQDARETLAVEKESCAEGFEARRGACGLVGEQRYDPDPLTDRTFVDDPNGANPFLSLEPGGTTIFRVYEDGEQTDELIIVRVTDEIREIRGVPCRVVVDVALEEALVDDMDDEDFGKFDYTPLEATDDWYAQDVQDNIYYCGELSRNFEDGVLTDLDGSFEAGKEDAKSGTLLRAVFPGSGVADRQEFALGEAEDIVVYLSNNASPPKEMIDKKDAFDCNGGCLETRDLNPHDPGGYEIKYYLPGTGFVLAAVFEGDAIEGNGEFTGEVEKLVCSGGDKILTKKGLKDCGIENPTELLEELCELAPDAFCDD
jgi:hypothetical protein